jgi:hypothetical protein
MSDFDPSTDDYHSVLEAGRRLHEAGWREVYSVNGQIDRWRQLVDQVEQGAYTMTIDDYTNDLAVREWLERARPMLTQAVRQRVDSELDPLDETFRGATFQPIGRLPGCPDRWWCRLPVRLAGELAEDAPRLNLQG